ncbi:MAG: MoxR family ATPase [Eubacteriales bacterium]|nr:MoxR family ATPase [Eubacteriales bacterium]
MNRAYDIAASLVEEVEKVIIGKHHEVVMLITSLLAGGHVLIEDVPGVGKTTLAATLAKAAGLSFKRAQFTPDVMASDITGFNIYNRQTESFDFKEGLVMCNILLADEINRASPKTQSALLESMEENRVTVDGVSYDVPDPFMVIATQNPTGYVGTYPLPEAQLDRFCIKLSMGYPTLNEEIDIINFRKTENPMDNVKPIVNNGIVRELRDICQYIHVEEEIYKYIVLLVSATRNHESLALGASPRSSLMLMRMAQAYAFMHRRNFVLPEDIAAIYRHTIAHRLILKQEAKLSRITADTLLLDILRKTEVPYKTKRRPADDEKAR